MDKVYEPKVVLDYLIHPAFSASDDSKMQKAIEKTNSYIQFFEGEDDKLAKRGSDIKVFVVKVKTELIDMSRSRNIFVRLFACIRVFFIKISLGPIAKENRQIKDRREELRLGLNELREHRLSLNMSDLVAKA